MRSMKSTVVSRSFVILIAVSVLQISCAPAGSPAPGSRPDVAVAQPASVKRIIAAIAGDPPTLYQKLNANNAVRGIQAVELLVNAGLTVGDDQKTLHPQLAEAVPSTENGLWKVLPDGRMETTWRIREGVVWHDGAPFTSEDLAFTARIWNDPEVPALSHIALRSIEAIETPDPRTITVHWRTPHIQADKLFAIGISSASMGVPVPRHILEQTYRGDKEHFLEHPYWTQGFIGTGPYRIREWVLSSHIVLEANDRFALGRPKIDEIELKLIPDSNVILANMMAGTVDMTLDRSVSIEQASTARAGAWNGRVFTAPDTGFNLWPQLMTPSPAIIGDARFRRALTHAIDRQEIVDVLLLGLSQVIHSWIPPDEPGYASVESSIVKYDYDPRRAAQIIESLGYTRGLEGELQDRSGQRLAVEARTITSDVNQKVLLAVADYWKRIGVGAEVVVVPSARQNDLPYRSEFPGFDLLRRGISTDEFINLHSASVRTAENNYRAQGAGTNYSHYVNPEMDATLERYFATVPRDQRMAIAGQLANVMTDQVIVLPMFYDPIPIMVGHRVHNVIGRSPWNSHQWEVRG